MPKKLPPCRRCDTPMVPGTTKVIPGGMVAHKSRHLCRECFAIERQAGRLDNYSRITRSQRDVIFAAADLAEVGMKRIEIIDYLGMSRAAFERAHQRAGVRMMPI